jgi:hypothetical protein
LFILSFFCGSLLSTKYPASASTKYSH